MDLLNNFLDLFVESAPWLLLGFLIAGLMKALVPQDFLAKHLGKPGFASTVKAAVIGAPLPLCSCGVIPAAVGLREAGASKAATTSFLISTPETGIDSISISYALLGPVMAITRPIAAIASAITAGLLVGKDELEDQTASLLSEQSCCATDTKFQPDGLLQRIGEGVKYTLVDLVKDIAYWLLLGLLMAAAIKTFVPTEFLQSWGSGLLAFIVMAAIGVPMYICATASTPLAAGLLFAGVSPGAVLVFLLVGPATNIATVGLVAQQLGRRALIAYLGSVIGVAFAFGWGLNIAADYWSMNFLQQAEHVHELVNPIVANGSALILTALLLFAVAGKLLPGTPAKPSASSH